MTLAAIDADDLQISPLNPVLGAEISGIDLTQPISERQAEALRAALTDHLVIFFRDQKLDFESQIALANVFGPVHVAPSTASRSVPGYSGLTPIHADANSKYVAGEDWHSDMTCDPEPPLGSILYLHTIPESGGDTVFSSMYAAYEALSPKMKVYLEDLTAVHDGMRVFGSIMPAGTPIPKSTHPVIRTHPVSGRKTLFVNKQFTAKINGLPADEAESLLSFLVRHVQRPEFQCRFRWRPHSVALWDNRALQHSAIWDYFPHTRSGYRVQIKGDTPF